MAKKKEAQADGNVLAQYDAMKGKHPDAMLLFRQGDFYNMYKEDAVKASVILALDVTDKVLPRQKNPVKAVSFPHHALDTYLPKLIRAGQRVAICDLIESKEQAKTEKTAKNSNITPNDSDMAKKKKEQAVQEEPSKVARNATVEKPANEKKADSKVEAAEGLKADGKQERKRRDPQMVTANGEKVTHGHAYQGKDNPENWYFTAKIDGKQLKPQRMTPEDLAAYQKKELTVPQLMERYYPTKIMPKVPEEAFKLPKAIDGPEGAVSIDKFNVYKEKDEQLPDYGKYKFYVQAGDAKMSAVASRQDLNAYFDRVATPTQLVEKNFGERLHLKSAYERYQLPEGVDASGVRVAKDRDDNKWKVSVDMGDKGRTSKHEISFDDGYSLFKTKTATREQIAAKYLTTEIKGLLSAPAAKMDKSASMKL